MPVNALHPAAKIRREGYVLLVVLAVSVLVVTVLGTLAKISLRRGLQAADAQRSLQQRWGALTLQKAVLNQAPAIFEAREEAARKASPGEPPPPTMRVTLTIGSVTYDLLLGDEDAKLNLNSLYHHAGQMEMMRAITEIAGPTVSHAAQPSPASEPLLLSRTARRNTLDENESDQQEPETPDAFRSWGEVFDLDAQEQGFASEAALPNVTTGITCWGNGQLNFRRASDQAILAIVGSVVQDGGAQRLLQRYRKSPTATISVLLQTEVSNSNHRERLKNLLSETSTNFSLWIHASTKGRPSYQQFVVMNRDDEGVTRYQNFSHSF